MTISVIGAAYVGLTTAACLAKIGHDVFRSESDNDKLQKVQNGVMPLFDPHLQKAIGLARNSGRLTFGSTAEAIQRAKQFFLTSITVGARTRRPQRPTRS